MIETDDILLEYMYQGPILTRKFADSEADLIFNLPHHGLEKTELRHELLRLYDIGYVKFKDYKTEITNPRSPCMLDIEGKNIYVFLTEKVGLRWEHIFKPDWDKYISMSFGLPEECFDEDWDPRPDEVVEWQIEMEARSAKSLEYVLSHIKDDIISGIFDNITPLMPWRPVDWKILSKGYFAKFSMLGNDMDVAEGIVMNQNENWKKSLWSLMEPTEQGHSGGR